MADPWCRYLNDDIAAQVGKHPRRFVGLGTLPMQVHSDLYLRFRIFAGALNLCCCGQDTAMACAELRRCVVELGLAGVEIGCLSSP